MDFVLRGSSLNTSIKPKNKCWLSTPASSRSARLERGIPPSNLRYHHLRMATLAPSKLCHDHQRRKAHMIEVKHLIQRSISFSVSLSHSIAVILSGARPQNRVSPITHALGAPRPAKGIGGEVLGANGSQGRARPKRVARQAERMSSFRVQRKARLI